MANCLAIDTELMHQSATALVAHHNDRSAANLYLWADVLTVRRPRHQDSNVRYRLRRHHRSPTVREMDKPWPWWVVAPVFIQVVAGFWGMWALPMLWEPLWVVPVAIIGIGLFGAAKANLRSRK